MEISKLGESLNTLKQEGLFRSVTDLHFLTPSSAADKEGKTYIVLSSNNYLGMTHEPSVITAAAEALSGGTGSGGSRLTTGGTFEAARLEKQIAEFKHAEDALIFNTGYMTNLGVLYAIADEEDVIFSDALNHASIIDGCRISRARTVRYRHSDAGDLEKRICDTPCRGQRFIVTDGVFSMDGDIAPLPDLVRIRDQYGACLIVDDAHATGVIGDHGGGTAEYWHMPGSIDIQVGTLSKALGAEGGYAAASAEIISWLRNRSRPFIFSTALSPAVMAAAGEALRLLCENRSTYMGRLHANTEYMRNRLCGGGLPLISGETPILPILVGNAEQVMRYADECRECGILVSAIRPPSVPSGTSRIRLTVTAAHTKEELKQAADVLIRIWKRDVLRKEGKK